MCCLWKQAVCNYHCDEWGGIMEVRLGLAPIALSPAPLVIKILSSTNLKKLSSLLKCFEAIRFLKCFEYS